ncbi:MAG: proteasome subunit beta [Candidatus Diapherotrites archaeon]
MTSSKEIKTGTTTVGLITKEAVVLASDMRASMGNLAYDEETKKIYKITENIAITIAGSVGDCATLIRFLKSHSKWYEIEREKKMNPKALANYISNILNANRFYPFLVQFIIGGINTKPEIYDVDPSGGVLPRDKYAVSGSGTELALSHLDSNYRKELSEEEGIKLAVNAVKSAKKRDIFSGGRSINVTVVSKKGVRELKDEEVQSYIESN